MKLEDYKTGNLETETQAESAFDRRRAFAVQVDQILHGVVGGNPRLQFRLRPGSCAILIDDS